MRFKESLKIAGSSAEVWKRASVVMDIPKYWHGTRSLEVVDEQQGVTRVKVGFAFGGSGRASISKDDVRRVLEIDYLSGPFTGRQLLTVGDESVVAEWDVRFKGVTRLVSKWNEGHFRTGTVHALERLVKGT
ncbi:MAG: hypothetical protein JRN08_09950 [Nitrososphaerota archaeon]|nr:hypothetical protein [Nitrososphaerota archaeon]